MIAAARRAPALARLLCVALVLADAQPALAYLKFGLMVNGKVVTLRWSQTPVPYYVTERGVPGVSPSDFQAAVGRAFTTWQNVPSSAIAYRFAGYTAALPLDQDGRSTVGFLERPDLNRVLASTNFLVDSTTGALLESDIFVNASFGWSTAAGGETGRYDVESIVLHEIGHLSGLGHSALGETELVAAGGRRVIASEAIMFPIAFPAGNVSGRTLRADDVAGISDLYPDNGFEASTGSISGTVSKGGQPLFGAHVVAFNPATGTLVAGFTLNEQGQFTIGGLSPGPHVVRVEPLDDADIDSFFDPKAKIDLGFLVTFIDRLVVVPRGGDSGNIDIKVVPK